MLRQMMRTRQRGRPITGDQLRDAIKETEIALLALRVLRISRSFSVGTMGLESGLRNQVALSYLLFRIADCIEDMIDDSSSKEKRFDELLLMLQAEQKTSAVVDILRRWSFLPWKGISARERALVAGQDAIHTWRIYYSVSPSIRAVACRWVGEMVQGMRRVIQDDPGMICVRGGISFMSTTAALDSYCDYVAGAPGGLLTELSAEFYGLNASARSTLEHLSWGFARTLHKAHIIKDFRQDFERGFCYHPWEWFEKLGQPCTTAITQNPDWNRLLIRNAQADIEDAILYVEALPNAARRYRRFCLMALLPALDVFMRLVPPESRLPQVHGAVGSWPLLRRLRCIWVAHQASGQVEASSNTLRGCQRTLNTSIGHN